MTHVTPHSTQAIKRANDKTLVFSYVIENDPVRVDLRLSLGVKDDRLVGREVRPLDGAIVRTHVYRVRLAVAVKVRLAHVATTIACREITDSIDHGIVDRGFNRSRHCRSCQRSIPYLIKHVVTEHIMPWLTKSFRHRRSPFGTHQPRYNYYFMNAMCSHIIT